MIRSTFVMSLVTSAVMLTLVACDSNKSSNGGNGGAPAPGPSAGTPGYAATPQPCNAYTDPSMCLAQYNSNQFYGYGAGYNSHVLPQSWPYGAWQWPSQWQPQQGSCGCPANYQPVYHYSFGLACAPSAHFAQQAPTYGGSQSTFSLFGISFFFGASFNWGAPYGPAVNNQNLNIPQTYYQSQSCNSGSGLAKGCDTRRADCSVGEICRPVAGGTTIGICVDDYF